MKDFGELVSRLRTAGSVRRIAIAAADDAHTLEAVLMARRDGLVEPVLVGDPAAIRGALAAAAAAIGSGASAAAGTGGSGGAEPRIIAASSFEEAAAIAAGLVRDGEADFLMKGRLETSTLLKAVLAKESGLRGDRIMSHVAFLEIPGHHKVVAVSDVAMLTYPDLAQKRQEIENAAAALAHMGIACPKVAVMSASEEVNPKLPESLDAAELKAMNARGEIPGCLVEGPISYDLAMDREAASIKGYKSPVAGDADLLLVPNITAGNLMLKALVFSGRAKSAGFVTGAKVPIVLTSRASGTADKYMSVVLAAAACGKERS